MTDHAGIVDIRIIANLCASYLLDLRPSDWAFDGAGKEGSVREESSW